MRVPSSMQGGDAQPTLEREREREREGTTSTSIKGVSMHDGLVG